MSDPGSPLDEARDVLRKSNLVSCGVADGDGNADVVVELFWGRAGGARECLDTIA